ncbi:MAG: ESPR-type extended signal peptide-containing protein [Sutterella wadsworthensis]
MNSTFKVVFNKARGALMVVNEVTSSVQAKGTKTVVAAAVATMIAGVAGTAMAAEWEVAPEDLEAATDTVITDANWAAIKDQNAFELTASDKEAKKPWASVAKDQTFDKTLWVSGAGAKAHASGFGVSGEKVKFTNKGTIYVTSGKDGVNYQNDAIWAGNGATAINEGKIVAKDAYGMRVGTGDTASKIVNNGSIYVESTGAGMELGGAANSEAVNNGLISVGDVNTESKQALEFGHGVLIQDQTGAKFTNNGTITAGKGASAIEVKGNVNNTALNFGAKSDVNGLVHLAAGTTTLTFDATVDTMKIKTEQQKDKATVVAHLVLKNNANITLEDGQKSTYETVTLDDSRLNASIWGDDNTFKTVTVNDGSIFNITKLNSRVVKKTDTNLPKDQLLIARDQSFTYDHAQMYVDGKVFTGNLKVGSQDQKKGTVTLMGGDHSFSNLIIGANGSAFNVEEGAVVTVGGLHLYHGKDQAGKVVVNDSTLINTGVLTFEKADNTYKSEGKLELANGTFQTAAADFFKKKEGMSADAAQPEYEATGNQAFLAGNGTLNLTSDAFEYSLADLEKAQNLIDSNNAIRIVFANGTLKLGEGEKLDATSVSGRILAPYTGEADTDGSFAITDRATVGAIDFKAVKDKEATTINLGNTQAALTLAGNGGDVFKNLGAKVTTVTTGDLVLGTAGNSGNVNVDTLKTDALTVAGDFSARAVEVTSAQIDGMLTADSLAVANNGKAVVAGTLALTGNVKETASELSGNVELDEGSVLTTNVAAAKAIAGEFDESTAIIYVDRQLKLNGATIGPKTVVQNRALLTAAAPARAESTVTVADGMALVIDAGAFTQSAGHDFTKADVSALGNNTTVKLTGGDLELVNVNKLGELDIGKALSGATASNVDTDSIYVFATPDNTKRHRDAITRDCC